MAKRKKTTTVSYEDEFATLLKQIEKEGFKGIPKAMTEEGLEVLAYDLEEREKLARIRESVASKGAPLEPSKTARKQGKPNKANTKNESKASKAPKVDAPLTAEQVKMKARIKKRKGDSKKKKKG